MATRSLIRDSHLPFPSEEREAAGADLQAMLIDLIALSLVGKQAHWNVEGRHFTFVHAQLDEFVDAWRSLEDDVAERGVAPDGQAATVAATSEIEPLAAGPLRDREVVEAIADVSRRSWSGPGSASTMATTAIS
jgi:starvation-inducible DNA-binding protein